MAQSREVCCCGADLWTKVIAWLQILGSIFGTYYIVYTIFMLRFETQGELLSNMTLTLFITSLAVIVLSGLISLAMGIVLLKGANKRNPNYLKAWLAYTTICFTIRVVRNLLLIYNRGSRDLTFHHLAALEMIITTFILWVVFIFEREVVAKQEACEISCKV